MQVNFNTNYNNYNSIRFTGYNEALNYAKKNAGRIKSLQLSDYNQLEHIQDGLPTIEHLKLKQIVFALTNFDTVEAISGCYRHCLHCYVNAQPFISRMPFEVYKQILDDFSELKKRLGFNPITNNNTIDPKISFFFDSDCLDSALFDSDGNRYDSVDLGNMLTKATGKKYIFDTSGWSHKDNAKQKLAEDYVKKLLKHKNNKNCCQINLSINPFNPKYARALRNGYDPRTYRANNEETDFIQNEQLRKAKEDYEDYVADVANCLLTFSPLLKKWKLGTLARALNNSVLGMNEFTEMAFSITIKNILSKLRLNLLQDLNNEKKYVRSSYKIQTILKRYATLIKPVDTNLVSAGRLESLYKTLHNGSIQGIGSINPHREFYEDYFVKLKNNKNFYVNSLYFRVLGLDGTIYLYDNYHLIPTDIKFNLGYTPTRPPFSIKPEDFVFTTDMIDEIL